MSSSSEQKKNRKISFLGLEITQENGKSVLSVYRKSTFTGAYLHFDSFFNLPYIYILFGLYINILMFSLSSDWTRFFEIHFP